MKYWMDLSDFREKEIHSLGDRFSGKSKNGGEISFTNYYMMKNGKPFFGISGEFHFSRMDDSYWEDEIAKMKMGGINVIATYVFWIHHEEEEGNFNFTGRRNLPRFIELCAKYELYVILRVGPFDHGEVRNGGLPDWLYGKPFEVRQLNEGFLHYTRRLYTRIAQETEGQYFKDGGPIIGTQIDNEYMHSSAPWEITTGISNEWVFGGNEGDTYMLELKKLAAECGIEPVFYTCTGWGGASTPECMLPLWGGYAFQPWLFYSYKGEHPSTEEYIYRDLHNNEVPKTYNFEPKYKPEDKPYACCEMGGGMMCSYYYRFQLPYKSVDAMANVKMASGCNFLGYYVFQGGSNPVGAHGTFLNEGQVSKISYDYQAALGEYGQVRESYQRLKTMHYFANAFSEQLCGLKTMLPEGASQIAPKNLDTLRYAVRTDGHRGFVFLNNYQDHEIMPTKEGQTITLKLADETLSFEEISIAGDENCILPFHFHMQDGHQQGIDLVSATAQVVTRIACNDIVTYVFMVPDGMRARFVFEEGVSINKSVSNTYEVKNYPADSFIVEKDDTMLNVLCVSRELSNRMYLLDGKGLIFTDGAVLVRDDAVYVETNANRQELLAYPADLLENSTFVKRKAGQENGIFGTYEAECKEAEVQPVVQKVAENRYTIAFPKGFMQNAKDMLLQMDYRGDIGHAFIDGQMIHDNFCNGSTWEIGLRNFSKQLEDNLLTVYITPLKEGATVHVESSMAARIEEVVSAVGELDSVNVMPVYEMQIL